MPLLLICPLACAATLHEQLLEVAKKSDRVELTWRPELGVEVAGIVALKRVYAGPAIDDLMAHIEFIDDHPKEAAPPAEPGAIIVAIPNCCCTGSHLLRFIAHDQPISEVSFHHGTHLRSKLLNRGRDSVLTDSSQKWLQVQADWDADLVRIDEFASQRRSTQRPNHNAGSRTSSVDSPESETPSSLGPRG